ncbi:hypothetical protein [Tamilnaduibacter salinus]|nr:hypothetical protein [Tamilnaduibacter salinus]
MRLTVTVLMVCLVLAHATLVTGAELQEIEHDQPDDVYVAGLKVRASADLEEDFVAAARRVLVEGTVGGDAVIAGEEVLFAGLVSDDIRAAGRTIEVRGEVGDHVVAAGSEVRLKEGSEIGAWASLAGTRVIVDGLVGGFLKIRANHAIVSGEINGDADVAAANISIREDTIINGDLIWRGENEPDISEGARIGGRIIEKPTGAGGGWPLPSTIGVVLTIGLTIGALVAFLTFPRSVGSIALVAIDRPIKAIGVGTAVLLLGPVVAILFLATVFGYVLGLFLGALYLLLLILAAIVSVFVLSDFLVTLFPENVDAADPLLRLVSILVVGTLLSASHLIPILGWLLGLTLAVTALGAILVTLNGIRRGDSSISMPVR